MGTPPRQPRLRACGGSRFRQAQGGSCRLLFLARYPRGGRGKVGGAECDLSSLGCGQYVALAPLRYEVRRCPGSNRGEREAKLIGELFGSIEEGDDLFCSKHETCLTKNVARLQAPLRCSA